MVAPSVGPLLKGFTTNNNRTMQKGISCRRPYLGVMVLVSPQVPINMNKVGEHGHATLDMSSYIA